MNRGTIFGIALIIAAAGMMGWMMLFPPDAHREFEGSVSPHPGANVMLITVDTTRADYIGCYGGGADVTPRMDMLAQQGVTFGAMQAAAPITLPSHATMLSGLYPYKHGIRNNGMFKLAEETDTLATVFSDSGYATGAFVSAAVLMSRYGLSAGFDVYNDDLSRGSQQFQRGVPARRGDVTVEQALRWLGELETDTPFFCWIHLYDPHAPYDPPPEYRQRYPDDPYTGEIAFTDSLIGEVVDFLASRGVMEKTFLTVVADHGEALGEHGERTHATLLHQATTHVPWILVGPGVPADTRVSAPTAGPDVAATLANLAGLEAPNADTSDGVNVFADHNEEREIVTEILLPMYQYGWTPLLGLRRGKWQLIDGAYSQLFDLQSDPRELADLSDRETSVSSELKAHLDAAVTTDAGEDDRLSLSRSERDQLEALGYAGWEAAERDERLDPRDMVEAHVQFELARDMVNTGDSETGLNALNEAIATDPNNVAMLVERARLYLRADDFEKARQDYARCMHLDPDNATIYHGMAQLELTAKNFAKALELAEFGTSKRGAFESLSVDKAQALVGLDRRKEAEEFVDERLRENPDDPDLLSYRGELYRQTRQIKRAEESLRKAIASDALHASSRYRLAQLLTLTNRRSEAVAVLEDLLRIQPGNAMVLGLIGDIKIDDPNAARAYLEESVRLNPKGFVALVDLGRCYNDLGLGDKAEAMLLRARQIDPNSISVRNNLAIALIIQRRYDEAVAMLQELLAEHPDYVEARNNLALCLGRMGRLQESEAEARRAIASNEGFVDPVLTLASILIESDRAPEAVNLLKPFAGKEPEHPDFSHRYGSALVRAGRPSEALPWLEKAMKLTSSSDPDVILAYALANEGVGDLAEAQANFERAAKLAKLKSIQTEALAGIERVALSRAR